MPKTRSMRVLDHFKYGLTTASCSLLSELEREIPHPHLTQPPPSHMAFDPSFYFSPWPPSPGPIFVATVKFFRGGPMSFHYKYSFHVFFFHLRVFQPKCAFLTFARQDLREDWISNGQCVEHTHTSIPTFKKKGAGVRGQVGIDPRRSRKKASLGIGSFVVCRVKNIC